MKSDMQAQVLAIRASAAAIVAQCDALLLAAAPAEEGPCAHPEERRTSVPRMGAPGAWVCACGEQGDE